MRVHWLQHAEFEDLGAIAPWLSQRGAQVTHTALHAGQAPPATPDFDWLIVLGGPMNIYEHERHPWLVPEKRLIRAALDAGRTVLGICLGAQLIADQLGGAVTRNAETEIGWFPVTLTPEGSEEPLLSGWPRRFEVFHWHGDTYALPPGARGLARSEACAQQAFVWGERVVGLQFHPEITATNAARWFQNEALEPGRYVQAPADVLADAGRFEAANRLLISLLEKMA